jgi:2-haloacid dehalogenase
VLIAFDMFGTLADTGSVTRELAPACGDQAASVAQAWRARQVEYMFRVTAMGQFPPFADLTRWGLAAALAGSGITMTETEQATVASAYRRLRPFDDTRPALAAVRELGHQIVVFSVGPKAWLAELTASYREYIDDLVSAEDAGVYKPHPGIYRYLLARTGTDPAAVVLVSSNPFDIAGAKAAGIRTAWCRRDPAALFDPWGPRPDHVIAGLSSLARVLPASS